MVDEETKKAIIEHIETHEYFHHGMKHVNGGFAKLTDVEIAEDERTVRGTLTLGFQADQREEIFYNCEYPLDKILETIQEKVSK